MNREDQMRILQLRTELSEIDSRVNAIFHELDELGVFDISIIPDPRQRTLNALAADNLP